MSEETNQKELGVKHLEKLTVKELREIAAEIPHESAIIDMKKEQLIAFIKEARGIRDEAPARKKKHVVKIKIAKSEIKARIRKLKALREQALESKDNSKVVMLRHQISQLKKKSRRIFAA